MNKKIYRHITMLILMVMCLEVVLPAKICLADSKNGYVIYNNVKMERDKFKKVGDEFIYIPSETDWYNTLFLVSAGEATKNYIYYIDENGEKQAPTFNENERVYLVANQVYHFSGFGGKTEAVFSSLGCMAKAEKSV